MSTKSRYRIVLSIEEIHGEYEIDLDSRVIDTSHSLGDFDTLEEADATAGIIVETYQAVDLEEDNSPFTISENSPAPAVNKDLTVEHIMKVADIYHGNITDFTKRLILSSDETYEDKNAAMSENIFDVEETMEFIHSLIEATPGSYEHTLPEFEAIEKLCEENDCGYFRIINSI